jgi:BlaI family penicillinase repressor
LEAHEPMKGRDIPAAELEVLGALWRLKSATGREVLDDLRRNGREPAYTTVLTLLGRLERRGYISASRDTPAHVYRPRISREKVTADRLEALVEQVGPGQAPSLLLRFVEAQQLSAADIRQLRALLTALEDETRKRQKGSSTREDP